MSLDMTETDIPVDDDLTMLQRIERIEGDIVDIKAMLTQMVSLVSGIAEEAGPMIASIQASPLGKMFGGK